MEIPVLLVSWDTRGFGTGGLLTLAVAYKGRDGVLLLSDRLEIPLGRNTGSAQAVPSSVGPITGYGKGHLLTPIKECLEHLADQPIEQVEKVMAGSSPLDVVHSVIVKMLAEMREAWGDAGEVTFVYSLPAEYVPTRYSKVANTCPLAVMVDTGEHLRETAHANYPVESPGAGQFERLLRDLIICPGAGLRPGADPVVCCPEVS